MSEPQIAQAEIQHVVALREQAKEARAAANKKQAELEAEEERLIAALQAGTPVESGAYFLLATTEQTGRIVAWRGVVERELGRPFAEKTLADTPPGRHEFSLGVTNGVLSKEGEKCPSSIQVPGECQAKICPSSNAGPHSVREDVCVASAPSTASKYAVGRHDPA